MVLVIVRGRAGLDRVDELPDPQHLRTVLLGGHEHVTELLLEPQTDRDDQVRLTERQAVLCGRGVGVGVDPGLHQDLDLGRVTDDGPHHVTQHGRRRDDPDGRLVHSGRRRVAGTACRGDQRRRGDDGREEGGVTGHGRHRDGGERTTIVLGMILTINPISWWHPHGGCDPATHLRDSPHEEPGITTPVTPHDPTGHAPVVQARGLRLTHGHVVAVAEADLDLPAGGLTAVIGPNGSGKSTLLRAMSGLHEPAAGELTVCGAPPGRHQVAHVLQTTVVNGALPVTVAEVVRMGRYRERGPFRRFTDADRAAVEAAMERMEITDLAARHLDELSGGQRQRVYLAQGLAQEAELLLLDEPVTGLDLTSLDRISEVLREETAAGRTVIMTTHELHTAQAADHVVLLAGRVVASGPPDEVLTPDHLTEAYGGHLHELPGGELMVDEPHMH